MTSNIRRFIFFLFIAFAALGLPAYADVITVNSGWEYRVGDSPLDSHNIPVWITYDAKDSVWKPIQIPANVPDRGKNNIVWFRIKLPELKLVHPAAHLADIDQDFSLYHNGKLIYSFGSPNDYLSSFGMHIVDIESYKNDYLYLRVHSRWSRLGMYSNKLEIGERPEIVREIILKDFKYILIASILVVAGLLIIIVTIFRLETRLFLNLGSFTILLGLYSFIRSEIKQYLWGNNYLLWGIAELLALYLILFMANNFLCRILKVTWKSPLFYFRIISGVYAACSCIITIVNPNQLVLMLNPFFYLLGVNAFIATFVAAVHAFRGEVAARKLFFATVVFSACSAHDVIQEMGIISMTALMVPWGQFFLIFVMLSIAVSYGLESRKNLISIDKELDIARRIQMKTIPDKIPDVNGLSIAVAYHPFVAVGGDLYDFCRSDDNGFGIMVADAAGHGVPAALIASMADIAFTTNRNHVSDPSSLLDRMNKTLVGKCEKYFISALIVYIPSDRKTVRYARAGHPSLLVYRRKNHSIETAESSGRILGRFNEIVCGNREIEIAVGDRLIFQTDGITECRNKRGEEFGAERFNDIILGTSDMPVRAACDRIIERISEWCVSDSYTDDITLILVDIV